jgi:hypothetical protein
MLKFYIAGLPTFRTDFNKRDAQGRLVAAPEGPAIYWLGAGVEGNRVRLEDAEGNTCEATIDAVDGQILKFQPDWGSWTEVGIEVVVPGEFVFGKLMFADVSGGTSGSGNRTQMTPADYVTFESRTAAEANAG